MNPAEPTTPTFELPVIRPDQVRYHCRMCGECCREPWSIPVDEETVELLEQLSQKEPLATFLEGRSPTTSGTSGTPTFTRENGLCIFQQSDGICYLHNQFGPKGKGCVCRAFPLMVTETPEGLYEGYSFVCTAIREPGEAGCEVSDNTEVSLEAILKTRDHHYRTIPEQISFRRDGHLTLNWEEYKLLERGLLSILDAQDRALSECLMAGYTYLVLAERFLLQTSAPVDSPFGKSQVLEHFLSKMEQTNFGMVFQLSGRQKPSSLIRRFIDAFGMALLKQVSSRGKGGGRFQLLASVMGGFFKRRSRLSSQMKEALDRQLRRYFMHSIWRKDLIAENGPFGGQSLLLSYGGLLIIGALVAERSMELSKMRTPEDAVSAAIHQIERDLVAHFRLRSQPNQVGLRFFLGWWETLVQRRVYAASVTAALGS